MSWSALASAMLDLVRSIAYGHDTCSCASRAHWATTDHVLCAEPLVGNEAFAVILADDLMRGDQGSPGVMKADGGCLCQARPLAWPMQGYANCKRYAPSGKPQAALMRIDEIVEKPAPEKLHPAWAWPALCADAAHL